MKKIIKIIITCLVCLSIVGCSSGSGGASGAGAGKKEKNPDLNSDCTPFDFFDAVFKEEYIITVGYNGQGDILLSSSGFKRGEVKYENEDFQIIYDKSAERPQRSLDFGIYHDGEKYATVEFGIVEYKDLLKNGDNVILACDVYPDGINSLDDLGYDSEYRLMNYKVSGLDERVTSAKDINASQLYEVINSCSEEGTAITAYFLTLKKGADPKYAACDYDHYVEETEEGKRSVYRYALGRKYKLESILFIYYDAGEYFLSGEVRKHGRYTMKGIPNPLKNYIYDTHTYDSSFIFNAATPGKDKADFVLRETVYGLEWDVKEDGYGSVEEFLKGMYSEQYEITEIKQ